MNGTEQRERGNAVAAVQRQIDDLGTVVDAMDTKLTAVARITLDAINDDRTEQLAERHELNERLTTGLAGADMRLAALEAPTTLWQRLRWLVTGRR